MPTIVADTTFTGRTNELTNICDYFNSNDFSTKKVYNLYGQSGIGKSFVCRYLFDMPTLLSDYTKILVDFNSQSARRMITLIEIISNVFGQPFYSKTYGLFEKYYNSVDSSKPVFYNDLFKTFIEETNAVAISSPILIIMDTIEVVSSSLEWDQIKDFMFKTSEHVCFLCSGINTMTLSDRAVERELLGFSTVEIIDYFSERVPKLRRELKKDSSFLPEKILKFTKCGHPILCGLLADWLNESPSQIDYVLDNTREISEQLIITQWLDEATDDGTSHLIGLVLQLMAYFTKRMTPHILGELLTLDASTCGSIVDRIGQYSFVKYLQEDNNIILHNIVSDLIRQHHGLATIDCYYKKVIDIYSDLIKASATNISTTESSFLRLELTYYHMMFADTSTAIDYYEQEFLSCLDSFDFSMCNVLLAIINDSDIHRAEPMWDFTYQLANGDLHLAKFQPMVSIGVYEQLKLHNCYKIETFKAKADEMYARSIMNPCTAPKLKPIDAIKLFNDCIPIYTASEGSRYRLTRFWLNLGMAHVRIGSSAEAKKAFDEAEKHSTTSSQKIAILQELSKMLRLQQDVNASLIPLMKCESLIGDLKANKGKYFYYYGNTMRDLNEFDLAEEKYEAALKELVDGVDDFTLAELYLDYSWMEYLRSSHVNFDKVYDLLEKGWKLAEEKGFGTEFSEYYHIKYEIERDEGRYDSAFNFLSKALNCAIEYSNIYIILDCLNHRAQQMFMQEKYDEILSIIKEMTEIEKTDCGIRVFRGRAKLVQGDVYYLRGDYSNAFKEWKEGFCIVALYGNSRSNVELFSDLFRLSASPSDLSRKDKMRKIIADTGKPQKSQLKKYWADKRVSEQFDYFIDELFE